MVLGSASEEASVAIAVVVALGVGAQLVAARLRIPAILLLLAAGVAAGPGLGVLDPDEQFGELLFPAVSLGVGILLFEGGLGLRLDRFPEGRSVVVRLVTLGVLLTWAVGGVTVWLVFDVEPEIAVLIGAILTVSGPTVVIPLLRLARAREPVNAILRWEGIVIDPIGATLAIVVLDAIIGSEGFGPGVVRVATTLGVGAASGGAMAGLLLLALRRHWIPDHLHNPATLSAVVISFAVANELRPEAGLMATTVLGLLMANQRTVAARHISAFGEDLGQIVLGSLFVVIGARLDVDDFMDVLPRGLVLLAALVLIARPLAVAVSTFGTRLTRNERLFLVCMAPRGIVAASVAAVFSLELEERSDGAVPELVPIVFVVIVGTVLVYGIAVGPAVRLTRMRRAEPTGLVVVGAEPWVIRLAELLLDAEVPVLVVCRDRREVRRARRAGLLVFTGRVDSEELEEAAEAIGARSVLALSADTDLNSQVLSRLAHVVGRENLHELDDGTEGAPGVAAPVLGRRAFGSSVDRDLIDSLLRDGAEVRLIPPADEAPTEELGDVLVLVSLGGPGRVAFGDQDGRSSPRIGLVTSTA